MPSRPKVHQAIARTAPRIDERPSAAMRGYDRHWRNLRAMFIRANPLCVECKRKGIIEPAREVDHVKAFEGPDDPLRMDWENLQSLCKPCHSRKTARENR